MSSVDTPRRIIVLRHAKADWPSVPDQERPLADRGRRDAPRTGSWLTDSALFPDLVLCSPSVRTRETWKLVAHELDHRPHTVYDERLYEASPGELVTVLQETPDDVNSVLLVGHNPGVQGLTEVITGEAEPEALARLRQTGFPTAAVAVLELDGPWKSLEPGAARLTTFYTPKDD